MLLWVNLVVQSLTIQPPVSKPLNENVPTLAEVIANVAAHEKNISDMDAKWTVKYNLMKRDFGYEAAITQKISRKWCVLQGQFFRIERKDDGETIAKNDHKLINLYAYDGSKTRSNVDGIINVQDAMVKNTYNAFRPHSILLEQTGVRVPLFLLLKGGDELKKHPNAGYFEDRYSSNAKVLGYETIRSIKCIKIKFNFDAIKEGWSSNEKIVWLSTMHNYLPIRQEGFTPKNSNTIPGTVGEVLKFKELKEGIWLPALWKHTVYDNIEIIKTGTQKELGIYEGALESFDLHPNYPIEFFSKFDYPTGATYYELNAAGKITCSGSIHRDAKTGFFSWSSTTYTIVLLTILLILFLVYLFRHRVFRFGYA